jgi:hypothetical protein
MLLNLASALMMLIRIGLSVEIANVVFERHGKSCKARHCKFRRGEKK